MIRIGSILGLKEESYEIYKKTHANYWPELKELLHKFHFQNFTIFYRKGTLFSYYEYVGNNYKEDLLNWQKCELVRAWNEEMRKHQIQIPDSPPGDWWVELDEAFHAD